ncbi:26S proteasome regulatory subunit T5 [Trypanosoma rangeli SC58]|uniref:26S proteasome regulatory subunit T5 n=1 Tax=Trypanosoma rangeli SC58 TaxID=429131 RepID=A0A061IZD9_TRYRA|nr:26S proteasome regulatory subunit T5 [Trypanosoma rangeli SC58]
MSKEGAAAGGSRKREGGNATQASMVSNEELANIETLTNAQLRTRATQLQREIQQLKNEELSRMNELLRLKKEVAEDRKRVKDNNKLPYLVASISEILDLDDNEDEMEELDVGRKKSKRKQQSAIVKTSNRHTVFLPVVGLVDANKLGPQDLVGVNKDTYLVLDTLPPEYDSRVKAMEIEEKPKEKYTDVGGLDKQINEMIEAVVLPITEKEKFARIGIKPPKGVLLYGSPGTGKTMLARACAAATDACFLRLAGPQLVQMYIGEGARILRDAFALAKKNAPTIIFIDELDAIGSRRSDEGGKHGSREVATNYVGTSLTA